MQRLPAAHLDFIRILKFHTRAAVSLCSCRIDPGKLLEEQTETDMFWISNPFIYHSHRFPYTVLFGHTPQNAVVFYFPYKIGLDTGLVYGNMLTCLETEERMLYQINRGKKSVKQVFAP